MRAHTYREMYDYSICYFQPFTIVLGIKNLYDLTLIEEK